MKKYFFSILALAVAAMTTVSCSNDNDEFVEQQNNKGKIVLIAGNPDIESDTRTELGADGITPMWKTRDVLHTVTNYEAYDAGFVTRFDFFGTNTVSAKTSTFVIDNAQASSFGDFTAAENFYAIHGDGFLNTDESFSTFSMNFGGKQTPTKGQFQPEKDVLISKSVAIDANRDYEANPVNLQFKRLTGLLKINFKPLSEEHNGIKDLAITGFTMTTNNTNDNFAGGYTITLADGSISKNAGEGKGIEGIELKGFKIGDGNSIYMSVLPTTIKANNPMNIVLNAGGKKFKKEVVLKEDVVIPAGKITTLNISFTDPAKESDPIPGADNKVKVTGNTIDMNGGTGTLFKWHVKEALKENPSQLIMKGNMNALDFNILLSVLRDLKTPINLDIKGVNVIGDKNLKYTEFDGTEQYLIKDELRDDFFRGCKLVSVELPESIVEIGGGMFKDITTLESVRIAAATTKSGPAIFEGCTSMKTLYVFTDPNTAYDGLDANFYSYTVADAEKVDLYIYYGWDCYEGGVFWDKNYHADSSVNLWYGYTWKSLTLVNEDGSAY